MLYRLLPDPEGAYLTPAGARVTLQAVRWSNHAEEFTAFETLADCLAAWGLDNPAGVAREERAADGAATSQSTNQDECALDGTED